MLLSRFKLCGNVVVAPDGTVMTKIMSPHEPVFEGHVLRASAALYAGVYWTLLAPTDEIFEEDSFGLNEDGTLILGVNDFRELLPGFVETIDEQSERAIIARDKLRQRHAHQRSRRK